MPQQDPLIGQEIDGYRVLEEVGRGGMGVVFKAEDVALARTVALKMIARELARDESFARRFRAEARALARVDSPHITSIYALRRSEAGTFIVMEYVSGGNLAERMERGPLPWAEARPLALQTLTALEHAHSVGVIHRDIKPGNILLTEEGAVKVTDFGLAKVHTDDPAVTVTKGIAGTLSYMPPEQIKGARDLDARCDVYALGMTLYEMLTGRLPFERDLGEYARMRAIVEQEFPPPSRFAPGLPREVDAAVMKALAKEPAARYPSAAAMAEALEALPGEGAAPPREGARRSRSRWPLVAGLGGLTVLLALLGAWILGSSSGEASLRVETDPPGAAVFLDGERIGLTPLAVREGERAEGRLRVEREGFRPVDTLLAPGPGPVALRFVLRPLPPPSEAASGAEVASLAVTSAPSGAAVFLDGRRVGETPLRLDSLEAGAVAVRLERAGHQAWEEAGLALRAGEAASLHAELRPAPSAPGPERPAPGPAAATGTLVVGLEPGGSAVVAGERREGGGTFTLRAGAHTVRCEHPTYRPFQTSVRVRAGETQTLTCHFEARVNVQATTEGGPTWATVWIDGANTGRTTPTSLALGPGTYRVEVRREGYRTLDPPRTLTVEPGLRQQTERLAFRIVQE